MINLSDEFIEINPSSKEINMDLHTKIHRNLSSWGLSLSILLTVQGVILSQQSRTGPVPPIGISNLSKKASSSQIIIADVPCYIWRHGCGPTALAMVIGYYDIHGFSDLFADYGDIQTTSINQNIAGNDHYQDYSIPIDTFPNLVDDKSTTGGAHQSNCVADFCYTSWSSANNYYGWSWASDIASAFTDYVATINPSYLTECSTIYNDALDWEEYKNEINGNRPVVFLVDTDGDGNTDHFVTGIGYDEMTHEYSFYNTWDGNIHWYPWLPIQSGTEWGIFCYIKYSISFPSAVTDPDQALTSNILPETITNLNVFPNPFNTQTTIHYCLNRQAEPVLTIFNHLGQIITTLYPGIQSSGDHAIHWNGRDRINQKLANGLYFVRFQVSTQSTATKMILLK